MRARVGVVLLVAAIAVAGSTFALTSSAAQKMDPNLAKAEAFVDRKCPAPERGISTGFWEAGWKFNVLYGNCRAEDGTDQYAWFFDRGKFIGSDVRSSDGRFSDGSHRIIGLWRDGGTFAFLYVLYRYSDPQCCATGGGAIVRYRLVKDQVRRLDPLPIAAPSKGRLGR